MTYGTGARPPSHSKVRPGHLQFTDRTRNQETLPRVSSDSNHRRRAAAAVEHVGGDVEEFGETLRARISAAEQALAAAERDGDHHAAGVEVGTLEELRRIAREHGLDAA